MFSLQLMQQVVNYLTTKPYNEVAALISAIQQEHQTAQETKTVIPVTDEVKPDGPT